MVRAPACERARTWASLRLDDELSELEGALLDAHLARCVDCRAAVAGLEATTLAIRTAPLERAPVLPARSAPRGSMRRFLAAAASTVAVTAALAGGGFVGALHVVDDSARAPKLQRVSAVASGMSEDVQLLAGVRVLRNERPLPGRIVWPA
jgi:ferric-dicitrate binding protein FerR (iron transport regulator)